MRPGKLRFPRKWRGTV